MSVKNAYPEKPEVPYQKTSISEQNVIDYIKSTNTPVEVKKTSWILFVNESAHGKSGVNDNYAGEQADGSRLASVWDSKIVATTVTPEHMTGKPRRFIVFDKWQSSIDYLINRVAGRGLFIGGYAHPYSNFTVKTVDDLAKAYWEEWVEGDKSLPPQSEIKDIEQLYAKAQTLFV